MDEWVNGNYADASFISYLFYYLNKKILLFITWHEVWKIKVLVGNTRWIDETGN